jgi:hypothetical protein
MNRLTTVVSAALAAAICVACRTEDFVGPGGVGITGSTVKEIEWAGYYEGTGSVELLNVGERYRDVPMCLDAWPREGNLRAVVYVQMQKAPDALLEIADRVYPQDQAGICAGGGVILTAGRPMQDVTSTSHKLTLDGPDGLSVADAKVQTLELQYWEGGVSALLRVFRPDGSEVARLAVRLHRLY